MKKIDIKRIIKNKSPRLLKVLPNFLLNYMKRILHEEELNAFLYQTKDSFGHDFVNASIQTLQMNVVSEGMENIPKEGGCIIACNHPLGGVDGIVVIHEVSKIRKDIKMIVNDILLNLENLNSLFIPVNKYQKNSIQSMKQIDLAYEMNECIIVFPAGLVSRKQKGVIKDLDWKKSFITKAIKYKHNIIPMHIDARNSNFFYNLALFRKFIGIKVNIEMFYLVDEVFKQKGKRLKITTGKPIEYKKFTKKYSPQYWAEKVKEQVYNLGKQLKKIPNSKLIN
ncbi:MAG: 1-acyl-sn-glycerol-3-phosphate acyltransferase [Bacteroidia bacterium]